MSTAMTWQTKSIAFVETERLGELLGQLLQPPAVIELRSDLGGGKTTFVKGLARGLGSEDMVTSPTFTLSNIYHSKNSPWKIHHFDFYRLKQPGIMADELDESLKDDKGITVVEWGDIIKDVLPKERVTIELKPVATNTEERHVTFLYTPKYADIIRSVQTRWQEVMP
jgi:tRNA threonylcarbamoyladenosine biosynthesis protein TsaE